MTISRTERGVRSGSGVFRLQPFLSAVHRSIEPAGNEDGVGVRLASAEGDRAGRKGVGSGRIVESDHLRLAGRIQSDTVERAREAAVVDCAERGLGSLRRERDG